MTQSLTHESVSLSVSVSPPDPLESLTHSFYSTSMLTLSHCDCEADLLLRYVLVVSIYKYSIGTFKV